MLPDLLVFGGRSHANPQQRPAWDRYEAAIILKIRNGAVVNRFEYPGWPLDREVGVSISFRAASVVGDFAYIPTGTQIVKFDIRTWKLVETYTNRFLNDVHHVTKIGTIDEVVKRFGGADADFRKIPSTKPHNAHPNFVAAWDGEIWVTNWEAGRVESLQSDRRYHVSEHRIHDGIPAFGSVWFTAVNGAVIKMSPSDGTIVTHELDGMKGSGSRGDKKLGWCRSIHPLGETDVLVGFSKLRETKLRDNLKWLGSKLLNKDFAVSEPTMIARYDLARKTETWRFDLDEHEMHAVFSIIPV
ncbi:MAG: hypothetical protein NT062_24435 [Proteobacteria bacterium]|nr:hypothetical protein [Pseudomonadota bacterium]